MNSISSRNYQQIAIEFLQKRKIGALFADPGAGKTAIILQLIKTLITYNLNYKVLIIAPLRVCYNVWPIEINKWDNFKDLQINIIHGPKKFISDNKINIINPEGLNWLFSQKIKPFDLLIIDESTKFKSSKSQRFRLLKSNLKLFPNRRYILTGTPQPNSLEDIWSQIFLLDNGESLGKYITHFRHRWFHAIQFPGQRWTTFKPRVNAQKEISKLISDFTLRLDITNYRDFPPLLTNDIFVDMPPNVQKIYNQAKQHLLLELNNENALIGEAGAKYSICCQIANGCCYNPENKKIIHEYHDAKIQALKDLISELYNRPILLAYHYKHDLLQIRKNFKNLEVISKDERKNSELINRWNNKEIPILAAQTSTISHGVNLQYGGKDIVWFNIPDNWGDYEQFNRRIYGRDNLQSVCIHHIITLKTVDEQKIIRLRNKNMNNNEFCRLLIQNFDPLAKLSKNYVRITEATASPLSSPI